MPNDIAKLRRLMRRANYICRDEYDSGLSSALSKAWWFEKFRDNLFNGFARFTYCKKDGTTRTALGTLAPSLIPVDKLPKTPSLEERAGERFVPTFTYFDLDKNEWRSFNVRYFNSLDQVWRFNNPGTSSRQTGGVASAEKG